MPLFVGAMLDSLLVPGGAGGALLGAGLLVISGGAGVAGTAGAGGMGVGGAASVGGRGAGVAATVAEGDDAGGSGVLAGG